MLWFNNITIKTQMNPVSLQRKTTGWNEKGW